MNEKPSYYAIIPAPVRYCKALPNGAKLLYGEITALSQTDAGCYARNRYFADLFEVDVRTIQKWVSLLEDNGFIERTSPMMSGNGYRTMKLRTAEQSAPYKQESYEEIFQTCRITGELKRMYYEFIKHCQLNGRMVTNDKLYSIIVRLDMHYSSDIPKINSLQTAINQGYFDVAED